MSKASRVLSIGNKIGWNSYIKPNSAVRNNRLLFRPGREKRSKSGPNSIASRLRTTRIASPSSN